MYCEVRLTVRLSFLTVRFRMSGADALAREELAAISANGLLRSLEPLRSTPGAEVELDSGEHLVNFSSNDYLGLATDPEVRPTTPWRLGPILFLPSSVVWQTAQYFLKTASPAAASPGAGFSSAGDLIE